MNGPVSPNTALVTDANEPLTGGNNRLPAPVPPVADEDLRALVSAITRTFDHLHSLFEALGEALRALARRIAVALGADVRSPSGAYLTRAQRRNQALAYRQTRSTGPALPPLDPRARRTS